MKLNKVLNELSSESWNESHLQDLIYKAKNLASGYFIEKYGDDLRSMPKKFARLFLKNIEDEKLIVRLMDYRNFKNL